MNKQTLKKYYKSASSSYINSYVKIDNEIYIFNGVSIINPKQFNQNFIEMPIYNYSIKKYIDSFKNGNFRALDLDNYNITCDLIQFVKNKDYVKNNKEYNIGNNFSVDLQLLKTCCDLIHATSASIVDIEDAKHPVIFIKNQKTGAHGWLLPCKVI